MRCSVCALLLCCALVAQDQSLPSQSSHDGQGRFYVDGILYQFATAGDYTVVTAAHTVINHKFVAVKIRIYNGGQSSITVQPEDLVGEDAIAGRPMQPIPGQELAAKMRHSYNMARYAVGSSSGDTPDPSGATDLQLMEMMRVMAARGASRNTNVPAGKNLLYTDTPGALSDSVAATASPDCDLICRLRNGETDGPDVLAQLQKQNTPECGTLLFSR